MSMYPTNTMFSRYLRHAGHLVALVVALTALSPLHAQDRVTYYHTDHAGSPVAATDAGGEVLWRESYAPYGSRQIRQAPANELWFTGKREDATLGLHYFGARWYDAELGRFISVDPAGFDENNVQLFNRYAYANNNPYGYVDPDGGLPFAIPLVWAGKGLMALGAGVSGHAVGTGGYELATGQKTAGEAVRDTAVNVGIGMTLKGAGGGLLKAGDRVTRGVTVSRSRFPESARHIEDAVSAGRSNTLTIDRAGSTARRREALRGTETRRGLDRDEFPPAMFQEGGRGASVRHINPADNRGAGACIGAQCRTLPDGTRVRIDVVD